MIQHLSLFNLKGNGLILGMLLPFLLILGACQQHQLVFDSQVSKNEQPSKVYLYVDHSGSMQGFFNAQRSDAVEFIGKLSTDLKQEGIPIQFMRFGNKIETIANNFREFKTYALDSNIYIGKSNVYSDVLDSIAQRQKEEPKALFLVLTDGVLSVPFGKSISAEKAATQDALANFTLAANSIGVFHYVKYFRGTYYAQPQDLKISHNGFRNFFTFSFGDQRYDPFLQSLLTKDKKINTYQFFKKSAYENQVQNNLQCSAQLMANQRVKCVLNIDPYYYKQGQYWNNWQVVNDKKEKLDNIQVNTKKIGNNQLELTVDFRQAQTKLAKNKPYFLRLDRKMAINVAWEKLFYPDTVAKETKALIDHTKTFQLKALLEAFHYLYRNDYVLEIPLKIQPKYTNYVSGLYTFFLGQQPTSCWMKYTYYLLFGLALMVSIAIAVYVFVFNQSLVRNKGLYHLRFGGLVVAAVLLLSLGIPYLLYCNHCAYSLSFFTVVFHAVVNGVFSFIPFILFMLIHYKFSDITY